MSTMPAAIATGKVAAWIQPRQVGLTSTSCAIDVRGLHERQLGDISAPSDRRVRRLIAPGVGLAGRMPVAALRGRT